MTVTIGLATAIGILLGLLGGGGSILTVPLLVHVAGLDGRVAIKIALLIVGVSSIAALIPHAVAGRVRWRVGATFAAAGVIGAYIGGRLGHLVPASVLMTLFGLMMVFTAIALFRCRRCDGEGPAIRKGGWHSREPPIGGPAFLLKGFGVGMLTGVVGVGGGFLIVPALTLFAGLSTEAVGTSLLVIAVNCFSGLAAYTSVTSPPVRFVVPLMIACSIGGLAGSLFAERVPQRIVRRGFAALVLAIAILGFLGRPVLASIKQGGDIMIAFLNRGAHTAEAHKLVAEGAVLIDVRSPAEFLDGHLPGAMNIPVDAIETRATEIGVKTKPLVVYCRSGGRSATAVAALRRLGFERVLNLGPMSAW